MAQAYDDQVLAQTLAPPSLEDAEEALAFWRGRRRALPIYRRSARREADLMIAAWTVRVREARRARFGRLAALAALFALDMRELRQRVARLAFGALVACCLVVVAFVASVVAAVHVTTWMIGLI
jgi:hypothetical protein